MRWAPALLVVSLLSWPAAADQALRVTLSPPPAARAGARAVVGVSVEAGRGRTLHGLAPLFVDLEGPEALGLERQRLERADALRLDAPAATFRVWVRPTEAGTYVLSARVRGWVCRASWCRAVETTRTVRVVVAEPESVSENLAPTAAADPPPAPGLLGAASSTYHGVRLRRRRLRGLRLGWRLGTLATAGDSCSRSE